MPTHTYRHACTHLQTHLCTPTETPTGTPTEHLPTGTPTAHLQTRLCTLTDMHAYTHLQACLHTQARLQHTYTHTYRHASLILSMKTVRPTLGRNHRSPRSHHILCRSLASLCPRHNPLGLPNPACHGGQPESQQPALSKPVMALSPLGQGRGWKKSRNASIKRQKKETLYLMWVEPVHSVVAEALVFCLWDGKVCL